MRALIELLNRILGIVEQWARKQEQQRHESTVTQIKDHPGEFLADHFGGVSNAQPDAGDADKADPERKPNP